MTLTAKAVMDVPPEMVTELALGIEPPVDVAARYGLNPTEFATLALKPWFIKALQARKDQLEAEGWSFKAKMAHYAEDMAFEVWAAAKMSDSASIKLDAAKFFAKMADLEPKTTTHVEAAGSGFSITINIPALPQQTVQDPNQPLGGEDHIPRSGPLLELTLGDPEDPLSVPPPGNLQELGMSLDDDLIALPAEYSDST